MNSPSAEPRELAHDTDIWIGWLHLLEARKDLESPQIAEVALPRDRRSNKLNALLSAIASQHAPTLAVTVHDLEISEIQRDAIMQALREAVDSDRQFITLRRFLEIIDAGKRTGRFRMRIPYVPAPFPPQPGSPFQHADYENYMALRSTLRAFERSLMGGMSGLSHEARWGQAMFSALVYGGLMPARWLLALPAALPLAEPGMRWIYLKPVAINDDEAPPAPRRWFPDPLTRFLLLRLRADNYPKFEATSRADYHRVMILIRAYARERGFLDGFPKNWRELARPVTTMLHLHLPPWLVGYATGTHDSTSLPEWAWDRLINPPTRIVSKLTHREPARAPTGRKSKDDRQKGEEDNQIPEQLSSLGSVILKGNTGLRARVDTWRQQEGERLLPSIRLLADWLVESFLFVSKKRKPPGYRTAYQKINAGGSRLVGQLGAIDPLQIASEAAYIEWYQNALEDTPSVAVRRTVAHFLRSFHNFLVKKSRNSVPAVDDSGVFAVGGKGDSFVDANIIGLDTFFRAVVWLRQSATKKHGELMSDVLSLIASIAYFGGLRRSEVLGLRICDIECAGDICVFVRPNALRDLKTRAGLRVLHMSLLMPAEERRRLVAIVHRRKKDTLDAEAPLFPDFVAEFGLKDTDPKLELITEALQRAADDMTLRFHHLRHSFATWLLFKFWVAEAGGDDALPEWFLPTAHDGHRWRAAVSERNAILGECPTSRRGLLQVSQLLGHSGAEITLSSYIHLSDFILGRMVRRLTPRLDNNVLVKLTGRSAEYLMRLRRSLVPKSSDGDNVDAELLTVLAENEPGQRIAGLAVHQIAAVNFKNVGQRKLPGTPLPFILHFGDALRAIIHEGKTTAAVASEYEIDESAIQDALQTLSSLPGFIACEKGSAPDSDELHREHLDLPKGQMQMEIAQKVIDVALNLFHGARRDIKDRRTNQRRIVDIIEQFPKQWVPGSYLTTRFESLPDAKRWIWFLQKIGFSAGILVRHCAGKGKDFPSPSRQLIYWTKGLELSDLSVVSGDVEGGSHATRGIAEISVDLQNVPKAECRFVKVTGLASVRLALVLMHMIGIKSIPFPA